MRANELTRPGPGMNPVTRASVPEQADQIDKAVAELAAGVEELQASLTPFLRPATPTPGIDAGDVLAAARAPIQAQLDGALARMRYLSSELLDLRNRLAV